MRLGCKLAINFVLDVLINSCFIYLFVVLSSKKARLVMKDISYSFGNFIMELKS